jgi:hypothetical protein
MAARHLLATVLLISAIGSAPNGRAQIASPGNAGQNSGNNAFGSSTTSVGTPNFTQGLVTPLVAEISIQPDGTIVASPEIIEAVQLAIRSAIARPDAQILASIIDQPGLLPADRSVSGTPEQLQTSGLSEQNSQQLLRAMEGLGGQPTLTQLSQAITIFNQITTTASPDLRATLAANPVFIAISTTLRAARMAVTEKS